MFHWPDLKQELQNSSPPVKDAHQTHVVQQDGETVRLTGGPEVNLRLKQAGSLSNFHWLENLSEDVAALVHGVVVKAQVTQQNLLRNQVDVSRRVREALVDQSGLDQVDPGHAASGRGHQVQDDVLQLNVHEHSGPKLVGVRSGH